MEFISHQIQFIILIKDNADKINYGKSSALHNDSKRKDGKQGGQSNPIIPKEDKIRHNPATESSESKSSIKVDLKSVWIGTANTSNMRRFVIENYRRDCFGQAT